MVLFPALRAAGDGREKGYYVKLRDGLGVVLPVAMLLYAPLRALVGLWLPQYAGSLLYLAFLFPVCLFEVQTNLTVVTFLKVRCEPRTLLVMNAAALLCALGAQAVAVLAFDSPIASVLASLFGIAMRYAIGTVYLGGVYEVRNLKMIACMFAESVVFIVLAYFLPLGWGFVCCVGILFAHFAVCRDEARNLAGMLREVAPGQ